MAVLAVPFVILYNYLIINNYNLVSVTQLVLLSTIKSTIWDSQPDHMKKQNAPDSGQAFFVPELTGPGLAQRLENKGEIDLDSINYTDSKSG